MFIDEAIGGIHTFGMESSVLLLKSQAFLKTGTCFIYLIGLTYPFLD